MIPPADAESDVRSMRCSQVSSALGEPLTATAPYARGWLVVEQPGPWGRKALLESRLPDGLGPLLADAAEGTGTTVLLARPVGRGVEQRATARRRVWVAHTSPGGVRMRSGVLDDVTALARVDLAAVARGELPALGRHDRSPALFVCANGKRDTCCATEGRALLAELERRHWPDGTIDVYECSHIGGHRFAPTVLMLPWGTVHGRVGADDVQRLVSEAAQGRLSLAGYRGRSAFRRWAQAAEIAVREKSAVDGLDVLDVLRVGDLGKVVPVPAGPGSPPERPVLAEVRHADGRSWRVDVERREVVGPRPESCGGEPVPAESYVATRVEDWRPWR